MVRGTPAPFAYSLHMSRGSKRIVMVAFTRFHLVQRWNPPSIPRRCSNAMGGYRGLEHTPRWKGVGMPMAWRWRVVGRDAHELGPVARCARAREGRPEFGRWILFADSKWAIAFFRAAALMPMASSS